MLYIWQYDDENESGKGFNISFMDWDEFKEIIISRTAAIRDLIKYDCIISGIDFDMGYLYIIGHPKHLFNKKYKPLHYTLYKTCEHFKNISTAC